MASLKDIKYSIKLVETGGISVKKIILTFPMNGSPAMSSVRLDSDLLLRSATENPTAICDVVKQHCVFSLQFSI